MTVGAHDQGPDLRGPQLRREEKRRFVRRHGLHLGALVSQDVGYLHDWLHVREKALRLASAAAGTKKG
jgi:hypothetical protein